MTDTFYEDKNPDGWKIRETMTEDTINILASGPNEAIYDCKITAMYSEDAIDMTLYFLNKKYKYTSMFSAVYRWKGKDDEHEEIFYKDKLNSLTFWCIEHKVPAEFAKAVWRRSKPMFWNVIFKSYEHSLVQGVIRDDLKNRRIEPQKDMFGKDLPS